MKVLFILCMFIMSFSSYSTTMQNRFAYTSAVFGQDEATYQNPYYYESNIRKRYWLTYSPEAMQAFCQAMRGEYYIRYETYTQGYLMNMIDGEPDLKESVNMLNTITCNFHRV